MRATPAWRILTSAEADAWHAALARLPRHDIYFTPEYHRPYENDGATALAFVATAGEDLLFYPFLLRPIHRVGKSALPSGAADIETVYGYGGPLASSDDPDFLRRSWRAFHDWCWETGVVAEFVRFHPLLANHRLREMDEVDIQLDRQTVALELQPDSERLWHGYPSRQRNMVRKARKEGLVCRQIASAEALKRFPPLYHETMRRCGADAFYFFSPEYFASLVAELGDRVRFFAVLHRERTLAMAIILVHPPFLHYHLSCSAPSPNLGATNLLLHTVAEWGGKNGCQWLHLGGGRTPRPDDSLLRFKASLSHHRFSFLVGKRIHDRAAYEALCARWRNQYGPAPPPPYFLLYRLPIAAETNQGPRMIVR